MKALSEKLERERRQNEAFVARLTDMEAAALRRETDVSDMKRLVQTVNEEHQQLMKVRSGVALAAPSALNRMALPLRDRWPSRSTSRSRA